MNLSPQKFRAVAVPIVFFCVGLVIGVCVLRRSRYTPPPAVRDTEIHFWQMAEGQPQAFSNDDLSAGDELRVYDVRDLLKCADKWLPMELSSDGSLRTAYADMDPPQRLAWLIRDYAGYPNWSVSGKNILQINHFAGTLVIRQTPANHQRIAAFLQELRKISGMPTPASSSN